MGDSKPSIASSEDFSLDTSSFDSVIQNAKNLAKLMGSLKSDMDTQKNLLMTTWAGAGRDTFEKKYRLLSQQFSDLKDELYEIAESLLVMEEEYLQADVNSAKALDGVTKRY